jgi:hypothetical protein
MTRETALELAKGEAMAREWPWEEPIDAHLTRHMVWFGRREWVVRSNMSHRGRNVTVVIDDATGKVVSSAFAPR